MEWLVKVFETEKMWVTQAALLIAAFVIIHLALHLALRALSKHFVTKGAYWKHSFIEALHLPLFAYLWVIALAMTSEIVLQRFHPDDYHAFLSQIYNLSALIFVTWFLIRWTNHAQTFLLREQQIHGHHLEKSKVDIIAKLVYLFLFSFALIVGLHIVGVNLATLVTLGGIGGISLGFASKDVVSNFFGGLMIYLTGPFVVGDYIQVPQSNVEGVVEKISWYHTLIRSLDKQPSYVPNSLFTTAIVRNPSRRTHWTFNEAIMIRFKDFQVVPAIVKEIKKLFTTNPHFDQSEPIRIALENFGESSLKITTLASTFTTDGDEVASIRQACLLQISRIITCHGAWLAHHTTTVEFDSPDINQTNVKEKLNTLLQNHAL